MNYFEKYAAASRSVNPPIEDTLPKKGPIGVAGIYDDAREVNQEKHPFFSEDSEVYSTPIARRLGNYMHGKVFSTPDRKGWANMFTEGPTWLTFLKGAPIGAAVGGLGTFAYDKLLDGGKTPTSTYGIASILGGILSGAGNAYISNNKKEHNAQTHALHQISDMEMAAGNAVLNKSSAWMNKQASLFGGNSFETIRRRIEADPSIPLHEKIRLIDEVSRLDSNALFNLAALLNTAGGFGVGAIIARALGAGGFGTVMGGLAGGFGANAFGAGAIGSMSPQLGRFIY